jgi:hypothetical protein
MLKRGKGYIANVLINIRTTEEHRNRSEMYEKAADLFAPALFDALVSNVKLGEGGIICPRDDLNFALWALVPYIIARSGEPDGKVTFEEAATIRPDGGVNICCCTMAEPDAEPMKYWESFSKMGGPSWNGDDKFLLWLIDTEWGGSRVGNYHPDILNRDLSSLKTMFEGSLSEDDVIRMAERGYISRELLENGTRDTLNIVWLNHEADKRLRNIANELRAKYKTELDALKSSYIAADIPGHMRKAAAFGLQYTFLSDGLFIIYSLNKLIESGKLKLPAENQRNSLGAVIVTG